MPIDDKTPEPENLHTMHLPKVHVAVPTHARVPWQVFARELLEDVMTPKRLLQASAASRKDLKAKVDEADAKAEIKALRKDVSDLQAQVGEILAILKCPKP